MSTYEQQLQSDARWALSEGSRHFDEKSAVFGALQRIVRRLDELNVPYAVVGGMALFQHGFRRFTEDVDILVKSEDLQRIHEQLEGLGYLPLHKHSKNLRNVETGVRIEFLVSGEYPGDGRKKSIAFPNPESVSVLTGGIKCIDLTSLIDLKLASGMSGAGRLKDLADVSELTKILGLPLDFSEKLHSYVRDKYREIWIQSQRRFVMPSPGKGLAATAKSIEELITLLPSAAALLEAMRQDGVVLESDGAGPENDRLVTTDPAVAEKYDMVEESEYWRHSDEDAPPEPR